MASFSPVRFGKYLLLDPIAVGGMAELHLARMTADEGFEKLIVVKKILPHLVKEKELVESFIHEARLAALLQHENIIRTYDFGRMKDDFFIAMEFLFGKNLRMICDQARNKNLALGLGNILNIVGRICAGLDYAHKLRDLSGKPLNIVHRDISPPNIFISYDGHVKVVDFGVAKTAGKDRTTKLGIIKGKVAYMSPEQANGKKIDLRSDIFAVGSILYELVTKKRMYEGETMQVLAMAQEARFEPPQDLVKSISPGLLKVFNMALAKDPDKRYQTCGDMFGDLEDVMVELSIRPSARNLESYMRSLYENDIRKEELRIRDVALLDVSASSDGSSKAGKFSCPSCGKPVEQGRNFCPWCDANLKLPDRLQAHELLPMLQCPSCGKKVNANYQVCNYCGVRLKGSDAKSIEMFTGADSLPEAAIEKQKGRDALPIIMYYNAGKICMEKAMDFLEMAVANTNSTPINGLKIRVTGTMLARNLEERLPFSLDPGRPYPINISGFLPRCAGKDSLHISVSGRLGDGEPFYLLGSMPVEVAAVEKAASNVNVNISAKGPLIVDMEDALPGLGEKKPSGPDQTVVQWIPVELYVDRKKQEDATKKFPAACVSASVCRIDEAVVSAIHSLSPENAPMARFSCPDGTIYNLIPGSSLLLGRKRDVNHVPAFLFPENAHEAENVKISRSHCRIFIRKNRVYIRDTSSNGTYIGKKRLGLREDVILSTGQQVVIGGVLELEAGIFTDGDMIIAVTLKRRNNKTNERYILAHGPVPIGPGTNLPIRVAGAPKFIAAIYYDPLAGQWRLCAIRGFAAKGKDIFLKHGKEIAFGETKCKFDILTAL